MTPCPNDNLCCGPNPIRCCDSGGGFQWGNATFINLQTRAASGVQIRVVTTTVTSTATSTTTTTAEAGARDLTIMTKQLKHEKLALEAGLGTTLVLALLAVLILSIILFRRRAPQNSSGNQAVPTINEHRQPLQQGPTELPPNARGPFELGSNRR